MARAPTVGYVPSVLTAVTPYLLVSDIAGAVAFYLQAFGAEEIETEHTQVHGQLIHSAVRIDGAPLELGRHGSRTAADADDLPSVAVHLYVRDVDATVSRAKRLGARVVREPRDQPYGDREATIADPFGITWYVATRVQG